MKNIRVFYLKIFRFLEVKFSIYLNRRVFVMISEPKRQKTYSKRKFRSACAFWIAKYHTKHAYSNILKISPLKAESFQIKILIFFMLLLKT